MTQVKKPPAKRVDIVRLKLVKESSVLYEKRYVHSPYDAAQLISQFIADLYREQVVALCLDTKNQPTLLSKISLGTLNQSMIHPREVFKTAILSNAAGVIIAHNHPSGDLTPSKDDIGVTERLKDVGELLGINLLDHVIVGPDKGYLSFREQGLL